MSINNNGISEKKDRMGVSIVIPFFNEEDGMRQCCGTMDCYAQEQDFPIEIVFVDDGSQDNSAEIVKGYSFAYISKIKLIRLSKNYGSHAAMRAGIKNVTYDICTWIGCDLEDPLELIEISYEEIISGIDAVYIERKSIDTSFIHKIFSRMYSFLIQKYAVSSYTSSGISSIVFNRKIIDYLNCNIESNSSIMLQIINAGFKYKKFALDYNIRTVGKSKWTLQKKIKLFIDSFVSFSFMPIRMVSFVGILIFAFGLFVGIYTIINKFINPLVPLGYSTLVSIIALGFGVTNVSLGIIAEYLWRTYDVARKRPVFLIDEIICIKDGKQDELLY